MLVPNKNPKVYDQVIEKIKDKIKYGEMKREINYLRKERWQNLLRYRVHL